MLGWGSFRDIFWVRLMVWTAPPGGIAMCHVGECCRQQKEGAIHMRMTTLGIDLAKSVFQSVFQLPFSSFTG